MTKRLYILAKNALLLTNLPMLAIDVAKSRGLFLMHIQNIEHLQPAPRNRAISAETAPSRAVSHTMSQSTLDQRLYDAIYHGLNGEIEALLRLGADPSGLAVCEMNKAIQTPLACAAELPLSGPLIMLLASPLANALRANEDGSTPLMAAAVSSGALNVEILLPLSDIDATDCDMNTALSMAIAYWKPEACALLARAANLEMLNAKGQTPLMQARQAAEMPFMADKAKQILLILEIETERRSLSETTGEGRKGSRRLTL